MTKAEAELLLHCLDEWENWNEHPTLKDDEDLADARAIVRRHLKRDQRKTTRETE